MPVTTYKYAMPTVRQDSFEIVYKEVPQKDVIALLEKENKALKKERGLLLDMLSEDKVDILNARSEVEDYVDRFRVKSKSTMLWDVLAKNKSYKWTIFGMKKMECNGEFLRVDEIPNVDLEDYE